MEYQQQNFLNNDMNNAKHTKNLNNLSLFLLTHQRHYIARNNNGISTTNCPFQQQLVAACVHIVPPSIA